MNALASTTGSWILIERQGTVLGHAPGVEDCPPVARDALLQRSLRPLRDAVHWNAGEDRFGVLEGLAVQVESLIPDVTAWAIGGAGVGNWNSLREALWLYEPPVHDSGLARLLLPASSGARAPLARLLVIKSPRAQAVARRLLASPSHGVRRVHMHDGFVLVPLDSAESMAAIRRQLPAPLTLPWVADLP